MCESGYATGSVPRSSVNKGLFSAAVVHRPHTITKRAYPVTIETVTCSCSALR